MCVCCVKAITNKLPNNYEITNYLYGGIYGRFPRGIEHGIKYRYVSNAHIHVSPKPIW